MQTPTFVYFRKWVRVSLLSLMLVAFLGMVMRYKIAYSLPIVDQNNFLEAHSHFAFAGWVTQILMTLMWYFLHQFLPEESLKKYRWILWGNLIAAYGMLFSFAFGGYGLFSLTFSFLSILVSWVFTVLFWADLNRIPERTIGKSWFRAALIFNFISAFGAFYIAYLVEAQVQDPDSYLAATYFYLHFQYNGWFFFACMGLFGSLLQQKGWDFQMLKKVFWLFAISCVPAYFLSALWLPMPGYIYILVILAAAGQFLGWAWLLGSGISRRSMLAPFISAQVKWLFSLAAVALSIKLLLQLCSVIPPLSKLAFGFRPVVIGYLHLMFLGVITLFLLGYSRLNRFITTSSLGNAGVVVFVIGVLLNELFLMIQGLSYMNYTNLPYGNASLFGVGALLFLGMVLLVSGLTRENPEAAP
ncbi:MAG: hypothetical protein KGM98_15575 [Bacteroidota bacterium]|nr:hypothetical protein [Bacteroidota bacterium]